jgi:hypothetical protein
VRIADETDLVPFDLVSGTARTIAAGQEIALSVPPMAFDSLPRQQIVVSPIRC